MNNKFKTSLDLERPRLLVDRFISSAQESNIRQRDAPRVINLNIAKQPLIKPKSPFVRAPQKDSLRERKIKEWAFKKIDLKELLKSRELDPKNEILNKKTELIVDEDEILGLSLNKIDLTELVDTEADDEFYRKHRNSGMYKNRADAQKNILFKLLDKRLLDISKDRFKKINHVDYQKKIFIKKQLLKSKSLPGLNCEALETFNPHQFDQLQDMEEALNNLRKKEKASPTKSGSKNLNFVNSSYLLSRSREKSMIKMCDMEDFEPDESIRANARIQNTGLNFSKSDKTKKLKSINQLSFDSNINDKLNESLVLNNNLTALIFEDSLKQSERANTFHGRENIKPGSIYRFPSKISTRNSKAYSNEDGIRSIKVPIIDHRFNNLINFIKPCYLHKEPKDVNKIINENEALKSDNLNFDAQEKMKNLRESGEKLADIARNIIEAGDYSVY